MSKEEALCASRSVYLLNYGRRSLGKSHILGNGKQNRLHIVAVKKMIPKSEWEKAAKLADNIFQSITNNKEITRKRNELIRLLHEFSQNYPYDSRSYASLGDLIYNDDESLIYYEKAYNLAILNKNNKELSSIATSAYRCCLESNNISKFIKNSWENRLIEIYPNIEDAWEKKEAEKLLKLS